MVQIVYDKIIDFCGMTDIPCVIVGSKTDLHRRFVSFPMVDVTQYSFGFYNTPFSRQVDPAEGEQLAQVNNAAWIETSSKNNINVGQYLSVPPSLPALIMIFFG